MDATQRLFVVQGRSISGVGLRLRWQATAARPRPTAWPMGLWTVSSSKPQSPTFSSPGHRIRLLSASPHRTPTATSASLLLPEPPAQRTHSW